MNDWNDLYLACCGVSLPDAADRQMLLSLLREEYETRVREAAGGEAPDQALRDRIYAQLAAEVRQSCRRVTQLVLPEERSTPLDDWDMSLRTHNCLMRAGIRTVGDLLDHSWEEIRALRNMGEKCLRELERELIRYMDACLERNMVQGVRE